MPVKCNQIFGCAMVELQYSAKGSMEEILVHDLILEKAVKEVTDVLYVFVSTGATKSDRDLEVGVEVSKYIISLYLRLWDEMIAHKNLKLKCIVLGDVPGAEMASRDSLLVLPEIEAFYSQDKDKKTLEAINKKRFEHAQKEVLIPSIPTRFLSSTTDSTSDNIYYIDSKDVAELPKFRRVAIGGTFDRIHNGHKILLALALVVTTDSLVIGVTGDAMLKKKTNASMIASYSQRSENVVSFLNTLKPQLKYEPTEIADPFGPTITDGTIEAIVVSSETIPGAQKINQIRVEKGLKPLSIVVTRRCQTATLSSSFIREQKI